MSQSCAFSPELIVNGIPCAKIWNFNSSVSQNAHISNFVGVSRGICDTVRYLTYCLHVLSTDENTRHW